MLAAKCDRCGMFYMPKKPSDIDYIHGHTYPRVVYLNSDGNQRDYDLCPFCVQELEGFMGKGEKPKSDWIPVSERLPEHEGWYLVSLKNGNVQKAWYRVAPINQGGSYWRGSIKRPIAWMPLPEPYKAGRANDDKI